MAGMSPYGFMGGWGIAAHSPGRPHPQGMVVRSSPQQQHPPQRPYAPTNKSPMPGHMPNSGMASRPSLPMQSKSAPPVETFTEQLDLEVWIVRHGETRENITRTIAGHNTSGLTPLGHKQAECTAERLKGMKFKAVYVSDLVRTRQTAEWILKTLPENTPVTFDKRLREKVRYTHLHTRPSRHGKPPRIRHLCPDP
jgi:hypothetical protein